MNIVLHILIIFFFIFIIFYFNQPCMDADQNLEKKFYLFIAVFTFEFSFGVIASKSRNCIVDVDRITKTALFIALFALTGLSFWQDFKNADTWHLADKNDPFQKAIITTTFIVMFIMVAYFLNTLFFDIAPPFTDCLHDLYSFNIPQFFDEKTQKIFQKKYQV